MIDFTEHEKEILRKLAKGFKPNLGRVVVESVAKECGMGCSAMADFLESIQRLGFVTWDTYEAVTVLAKLVEFVHKMDNPPPKDYVRDMEVWFRSRWWSIPLVLIVALPPIIVQGVEWIVALFLNLSA